MNEHTTFQIKMASDTSTKSDMDLHHHLLKADGNGDTPLHQAAQAGQLDVCATLLAKGATHRPNNKGDTPLHKAANKGHAEVCELLLDNGAASEPNKPGDSPLWEAASEGYADVCKLLLDRGATHEADETEEHRFTRQHGKDTRTCVRCF